MTDRLPIALSLAAAILANTFFCAAAVIQQKSPNPVVIDPAGINVLKAPSAEYSDSLKPSAPPGLWIQNWTAPEEFFRWTVSAPKSGQYAVELLASGEPGTVVEIAGPRDRLNVTIPDGNDVWGNNWNRLPVSGRLSVPEGRSIITVTSAAPKGASTSRMKSMALMSLELVNVSAVKDLNARVRSFRSSTKWFADAKYGVFLQWGEWGYPPHGDKKKWPRMIDDFDVEKFADTMQDIGAGYVVWSATWRTHYFPAPIKAIDHILPGRTSERDLIGELIGRMSGKSLKFEI